MKRTKKGEITVFLSLIFVLLVSFILALTESAVIQTTKNQKRLDADRAVFSLFGEYQKALMEEYNVFAIDGTYETGQYEENLLLDRMSYYGSMGISQEITDLQLLTDNQGQAFREQVLKYMETRTGIALAQDLTKLASRWEEQEIQGSEISGELDDVIAESGEQFVEEMGGLIQAKKSGMLSLVLPKDFHLSGKTIRPEEQVSGRVCRTGRGSFPERKSTNRIDAKALFEFYIMEKFGSALESKGENRNLDYEVEYILCGKESDAENLKSVVNQLLMVRFAVNYTYLMSDTKRQGEAEALAAALSAAFANPAMEPVLKQAILVLWSLGESVMDLRALLAGKKIPITKNEENWQLQLSNLTKLGEEEDTQEGQDSENGLTYQQCLHILILSKSSEKLTMRTLDRVEQNLIQEKELSFFRADACVTKIKVYNTADIWNGTTYTFPLYYGYL